MKAIRASLITMAAGLAWGLVACGGGGGGGSNVVVPDGVRSATPSGAADIRADNLDAFIGPMARAVLTGGNGAVLDPIGSRDAGPSAATRPGAAGAAVAAPTAVGGMLMRWLHYVPATPRRHALAVQSEEMFCSIAGSVVVTFDDVDGDQEVSAGDVLGFLAYGCIDDPSMPAVDGGFTMTINAVDLTSSGEPEALDVSATFEHFTLAGYGSMDGAFRLWVKPQTAASTRLRVSYLAATVSDPSGTAIYDFDVDGLANASDGSFDLGGGFGLGGQTYAFASTVRVAYGIDAPPSSGELRLRDAGQDELRLLPRSAQTFDVQFWPAGATQPALTLNALAWSDYTD